MPSLTVAEIIKEFNLEVLYCNQEVDLNERAITTLGINRGGLELIGFKSKKITLSRRVMLLSSKENEYLDTLQTNSYQEHFVNLLEEHIPAIFVTTNFKYDQELCQIAKKLKSKVPIIKLLGNTFDFASTINLYITERLAPATQVHGTFVNIFGNGVLITGPSGIGKSEITLDLIRNGHLFIGDDSINVLKINNKIFGKPNEIVKNLIEIRGIGILDVTKMYGYHVILPESQVHLIIKLISANSSSWNKIDRIGDSLKYADYFGVKVPLIQLPVTSGRNLADLIESAVISLKLKTAGQDSAVKFQEDLIATLKQPDKK